MAGKAKRPTTAKLDFAGSDLRVKDIDKMLRALETETERMSDWEKEFLASISDRFFIEDKDLTPNQYLHLEKLYDKMFSGCK